MSVHERPGVLLLVHAITLDNPVVPLGAGDRRAEPDLLVGRLLVQDISADSRNSDVEDAGLEIGQLTSRKVLMYEDNLIESI